MPGWPWSVFVRLFGESPGRHTSRLARLCWMRRFSLVTFLIGVPAYVFVFLFADATWVYIALGVALLLWLQSLVSLGIRIRRERSREAS
jgi:hypothetical protein